MRNLTINFNFPRSKEVKIYYALAVSCLLAFCFINTYINPNMYNAPIYKEVVFMYSLFFETSSVAIESIIISIIVKIFVKNVYLKNVFIGIFSCFLLSNCLFGILLLLVNTEKIFILLNMISKCVVYCASIERSFKKKGKKAKVIGSVIVFIEHMISVVAM